MDSKPYPSIGDQVVYQGKLYWLEMIVTMGDGTRKFGLRQPHWNKGWMLVVNENEVLADPPYAA